MPINPDWKKLCTAFDPFRPLPANDPAWVDCASVRGDEDILYGLGLEISRSGCRIAVLKEIRMRFGDVVSRLVIDRRKLIAYALDPESPKGQHKAILFQRRLGYNLDNYESLLEQIEQLAIDGDAIATTKD